MSEIKTTKITSSTSDLKQVEDLFYSAFPENELPRSFKDLVAISQQSDFISIYKCTEGDLFLGFFLIAVMEEFNYGLLFAINTNLRGNGYGTKISLEIEKLFDNKPLLFAIEKPVENVQNYEQRVRRKKFYENLGYYISDITISDNGADYLLCSTVKDDKLQEHFNEYIEKAIPAIVEYQL